MDANVQVLWAGAAALYAGSLLVFFSGGRQAIAEANHTWLHALVCVVAGTSYLAMADGVGVIGGDGEGSAPIFVTRYADWAITTPLLLLGLAITAMPDGIRRWGMVVAVLLLDLLMVGAGFASAVSETAGERLLWFVLGCVFYLLIVAVLWGSFRVEARKRGLTVRRVYVQLAGILSALWAFYPILAYLGANSTGVLDDFETLVALTLLDFTSKVIYGLVAGIGFRRIVDAYSDRADLLLSRRTFPQALAGE